MIVAEERYVVEWAGNESGRSGTMAFVILDLEFLDKNF